MFVFFYASVSIAFIEGADGIHQLFLNTGSKPPSCTVLPVAESFRASAYARVYMDGDKRIRQPAVGLTCHAGIGWRFGGKIMALQELYTAACHLQELSCQTAHGKCYIALAQVLLWIHAPWVGFSPCRMSGIDKDLHHNASYSTLMPPSSVCLMV